MQIITRISLLLVSVLLFSCATQEPKPEAEMQPPAQALQQSADLATTNVPDHPLWLDDPRLANHIAVIGSSAVKKWGGEQAQYMQAMENAQANLSIEFKKHQAAILALKHKNQQATSDTELSDSINELLFENAIIKEEWLDQETGYLYLWLVLPDFDLLKK